MSLSNDLVNGINNFFNQPNVFFKFSVESFWTILFFVVIMVGIFGTWFSHKWIRKKSKMTKDEKKSMLIKQNFFVYIFVIIFLVLVMDGMWALSIEEAETRSFPKESFFKATKWLSQNLDENEIALIPNSKVFWSYDESLIDKTISYDGIWESSGVILRANITESEINFARDHLKEYINNNENIKYVVIDWVDKYGDRFFESMNCKKFQKNLKEAKRFFFTQPTEEEGVFWTSGIMICEITKT